MSAQHTFPESKVAHENSGGEAGAAAEDSGTDKPFCLSPNFPQGRGSGRFQFPSSNDAAVLKPTQGQFAGRLALSAGVIALAFAVWMVSLPSAANWIGVFGRLAPRMSVFGLGLFTALALQGARVKTRTLGICALLAVCAMLALQRWANLFEVIRAYPDAIEVAGGRPRDWSSAGGNVYIHARTQMLGPGAALLLMRLECALFAAVFLGTWMGRGVWRAWHFMTLLFFAAACDVWLNGLHVLDELDPSDPLAALRLPFVPGVGRITPAPAFTDILFVSAAFEASRLFRMHIFWLVLGAAMGYFSGGMLFQLVPMLSMPLLAAGMIVAAWPDMKLDQNSVGKAMLALALLILALAGLRLARHFLNLPPPNMREQEMIRRDVARAPLTTNRANFRE